MIGEDCGLCEGSLRCGTGGCSNPVHLAGDRAGRVHERNSVLLGCSGAFTRGRAMGTLTNFRARLCSCRCSSTCERSFPSSSMASVGNNSMMNVEGSNCAHRLTVGSMFDHLGCGCESGCLFRTGIENSNSSHFTRNGH